MRYLEGYSLRRWTWEHFENQIEIKQGYHQWELDRVYNDQLELLSLERRKMVSEQDPNERKWLEVTILAGRFTRRMDEIQKRYPLCKK